MNSNRVSAKERVQEAKGLFEERKIRSKGTEGTTGTKGQVRIAVGKERPERPSRVLFLFPPFCLSLSDSEHTQHTEHSDRPSATVQTILN